MSKLYVDRSKIHGVGVFTNVPIPEGTKMFLVADLNKYDAGEDCMTKLGKLINHKKSANCEFIEEDGNKMVYLRSLKDINPKDELTIDYTILPFPFKSDVTGYKD